MLTKYSTILPSRAPANDSNDSRQMQEPSKSQTPVQVQAKLKTGEHDDIYEQEANSVAGNVIRLPGQHFFQHKGLQNNQHDPLTSGITPFIQTKNNGATPVNDALASSITISRGQGTRLDDDTRSFMESRFNTNFTGVKIHTGNEASGMNKELNAKAFTVGNDIYFNEGQYRPASSDGNRLLAHELTHVVQQGQGTAMVQRDGFGDVRIAEGYQQVITDIKATPTYQGLGPDEKKLTEEIIAAIEKMPDWPTRYSYILKLKTLFETKEKKPDIVSAETQSSTKAAVVAEKARVAKPAAAKNLTIEEKASSDPKRVWVGIKGKFGEGTYYVDRTNPANIVVKAKVFLKIAGTGTEAVIKNIKQMEDGIEKAASMQGFIVDITFVDSPDADTFKADVDPSQWEDATNWSGGDPTGFAHELLHMFAFELDRYNYIDSHASNESMAIGKRLHWFSVQLTKPANWDNDSSLMGYGNHPLDDDACRVAGLDIASCVAARQKVVKP